jgi:hypothetical protein
MMALACNQESCTIAETGTCLLNNDPKTCPHALAEGSATGGDVSAQTSPLSSPEQNPRFPLSLTLTPAQAQAMMSDRYCTLVGILGDPNSGKTAALVSLYLLLSHAKLDGFSFADCRSVMAFDDISRRARDWNDGAPPEQMTAHTERADDRTAGFLHLRLLRKDRNEKVDFLLPDLPGEWSQEMVNKERVDRLDFLKSADVIWLMMDGSQLLKGPTREYAIHRMQLLIQRLAEVLEEKRRIILVLSRLDEGEVPRNHLEPLFEEARTRGFDMSVAPIASFAGPDTVPPGSGIAELLSASCPPSAETKPCWPMGAIDVTEERYMMRYRVPERAQ